MVIEMASVIALLDHEVFLAIPSKCDDGSNSLSIPKSWTKMKTEDIYFCMEKFLQNDHSVDEVENALFRLVSTHANCYEAIQTAKSINAEIKSGKVTKRPRESSDVASSSAADGSTVNSSSNVVSTVDLIALEKNIKTMFDSSCRKQCEELLSMKSLLQALDRKVDNLDIRVQCIYKGMQTLPTKMIAVTGKDGASDKLNIALYLPVHCVEDLTRLETRLGDPSAADALKTLLLEIPERTSKEFIYSSLLLIFSKKFDGKINFNGHKKAFAFNSSKCWSVIQLAMKEKAELLDGGNAKPSAYAATWLQGLRDRQREREKEQKKKEAAGSSETTPSAQTTLTITNTTSDSQGELQVHETVEVIDLTPLVAAGAPSIASNSAT